MDYRLVSMFVVALGVTSCGHSPASPGQTPPPASGSSIGPAGGSITSADGRARLDVPAGALTSPVSITIQPRGNVPLDPAAVGQSAFEVLPAGTTFQAPATLRLVYLPNLRPSGSAEQELRIHRLSGNAWLLDAPPQDNDDAANTISAPVLTGGIYGVRWPDPPAPCGLPEDRHFDFWLGEWTFSQTVPVTSGGTNSITRDEGGCRILENFNNGQGRSVSFFSRLDGRWHQTYVDTSGNRVAMAGAFDGSRMTMYSSPSGRWSWERKDDGTIRYFGESLSGGAWTVTFDSRYLPR